MSFFRLKYAIAIITAITIDALQFLLGVAIAAAFFDPATAGAILGCVISNQYLVTGSCWLGGIVGGVAGAAAMFVPLVGPALMATTDAIGAGLAAVVDFCFSVIGFAIIIPLLIFNDIVVPSEFFASWRRGPTLILKIIPGIDMLPFFTGMVVLSILECEAKQAKGLASVALGAATGGALGAASSATRVVSVPMNSNRAAQSLFAQSREARSQTVQSARNRLPLVDGIRASSRRPEQVVQAANDNAPAVPAQTSERPTLRDLNGASKQLMIA